MRSFLSILQLKIAGGYILLLALLCAVVFLVRLEHGKMEELDSREHSTNMRRKAVNRTFEKLLEFSFHDHFLLMQDSADIRECGNSCAAALDALNGLKPYYAAEQHPAIDTVSMLLLEKVGLADKAGAYPCNLSGGQCQRVAIARALAMDPEILCFDEPTSALDPQLTQEVLSVIRQLADEKRTMIVVTHEMNFARDVADRVIYMANGLVVEDGPAKQVLGNDRSEAIRAFAGKSDY